MQADSIINYFPIISAKCRCTSDHISSKTLCQSRFDFRRISTIHRRGGVDGYGGKLSHHHHPAGTSKARGSRSIGRPGYGRTANPNPADPVPRQRLTSALRHLVCYYNLQTLGAGARSLFSPSFPVAHWATMVRSLQKGLTKTRCPFCSL